MSRIDTRGAPGQFRRYRGGGSPARLNALAGTANPRLAVAQPTSSAAADVAALATALGVTASAAAQAANTSRQERILRERQEAGEGVKIGQVEATRDLEAIDSGEITVPDDVDVADFAEQLVANHTAGMTDPMADAFRSRYFEQVATKLRAKRRLDVDKARADALEDIIQSGTVAESAQDVAGISEAYKIAFPDANDGDIADAALIPAMRQLVEAGDEESMARFELLAETAEQARPGTVRALRTRMLKHREADRVRNNRERVEQAYVTIDTLLNDEDFEAAEATIEAMVQDGTITATEAAPRLNRARGGIESIEAIQEQDFEDMLRDGMDSALREAHLSDNPSQTMASAVAALVDEHGKNMDPRQRSVLDNNVGELAVAQARAYAAGEEEYDPWVFNGLESLAYTDAQRTQIRQAKSAKERATQGREDTVREMADQRHVREVQASRLDGISGRLDGPDPGTAIMAMVTAPIVTRDRRVLKNDITEREVYAAAMQEQAAEIQELEDAGKLRDADDLRAQLLPRQVQYAQKLQFEPPELAAVFKAGTERPLDSDGNITPETEQAYDLYKRIRAIDRSNAGLKNIIPDADTRLMFSILHEYETIGGFSPQDVLRSLTTNNPDGVGLRVTRYSGDEHKLAEKWFPKAQNQADVARYARSLAEMYLSMHRVDEESAEKMARSHMKREFSVRRGWFGYKPDNAATGINGYVLDDSLLEFYRTREGDLQDGARLVQDGFTGARRFVDETGSPLGPIISAREHADLTKVHAAFEAARSRHSDYESSLKKYDKNQRLAAQYVERHEKWNRLGGIEVSGMSITGGYEPKFMDEETAEESLEAAYAVLAKAPPPEMDDGVDLARDMKAYLESEDPIVSQYAKYLIENGATSFPGLAPGYYWRNR